MWVSKLGFSNQKCSHNPVIGTRATGRAVDPEECLGHSATFNKSSKKNKKNNSKSEDQGWIAEHGVKQECTGLVCSVVIQPTCLQGEETSILTVHSTLLQSAAGPPVRRCSSRCCRSTCQCPSNQLFSHRQLWDKCFAGHHTRPDESVHLGPEWGKRQRQIAEFVGPSCEDLTHFISRNVSRPCVIILRRKSGKVRV